jgi:predicted transcriptional regulator
MEKLTKAEEHIMRIIWETEPCTVADIRNYIAEELHQDKPPHSTVSTLVSHINRKGYLSYQAYGRTYVYSSTVSKKDYRKRSLKQVARDFFDGSLQSMVSFLVKEEDLDKEELAELLQKLDDRDKNQKA